MKNSENFLRSLLNFGDEKKEEKDIINSQWNLKDDHLQN